MKKLASIFKYRQIDYKKSLTILIWIFIVSLNGCIEPYNIDVPDAGGNLVVDGFISTEYKRHEVQLNLSTGYNQVDLMDPVDGARVTIVSDQGDHINLVEDDLGRYYTDPLSAEVGKSYKIIIETDGKIYESEFEPVIAVNPYDEIVYEYRNDGFADPGILVYAKDVESPEIKNYLKWNYTGHQQISQLYGDPADTAAGEILYFCVTTEKCDGCINISSDKLITGNTYNQFIAKVPYTSTSKYIIKIDKQSISGRTYDYFSQIDRIINNSGTIFDTPPTLVRGNIKNINNEDETVHGYFYASAVYSKIFRIRRDIFSEPPNLLPLLIPKECTKGELPCLLDPLQLPEPPPCADQPPAYWDLY